MHSVLLYKRLNKLEDLLTRERLNLLLRRNLGELLYKALTMKRSEGEVSRTITWNVIDVLSQAWSKLRFNEVLRTFCISIR